MPETIHAVMVAMLLLEQAAHALTPSKAFECSWVSSSPFLFVGSGPPFFFRYKYNKKEASNKDPILAIGLKIPG